jgi:hypothetical protein
MADELKSRQPGGRSTPDVGIATPVFLAWLGGIGGIALWHFTCRGVRIVPDGLPPRRLRGCDAAHPAARASLTPIDQRHQDFRRADDRPHRE